MKKIKISIVAAMSENRVIGNKERIPWHIREDLLRFKEKTAGHAMIMGRKTFESLAGYYQRSGKPMPKRINIIVTRDKKYDLSINRISDTYVVHSVEEAIKLAQEKEGTSHFPEALRDREILIAGGGQIFNQAIKYADKLYLTIVKGNFSGDAFFPDYSEFKQVIAKKESSNDNYQYTFLDLER